jgi:NitT/TauT family transport system substrate-binding protein
MKRLTVWLVVLMVLAACGGAPTAQNEPAATAEVPAEAPQSKVVRIGYVPVMIYAPLYVGIERGYFAAEGITIESTPVQGGSDPVVQLGAGNFDAALGGAGAGLFNAAARGVEFAIVAPMHSEKAPLSSPLVISASRTSEFTSVADLKGKKVAINATGAATEYWLAEALRQGGLTMADIELTTVGFKDVPAALANNSIDAAILGEPLATIAVDKGEVAVLSNDFIDGFFATYLYMGKPLLNDKATAQGFMRAYLKACADLQGDYMTDDVAAIIEKYTKVPADVVKRAGAPHFDATGTIPVDNLATLQSYFRERGVLEYETDMDVNTLIDQSLVASVQ